MQPRSMSDVPVQRLGCYAFRLEPGQELKAALAEFTATRKIKAGFILSCVGSVKDVSLRLSGAERPSVPASLTPSRPGIQATAADRLDQQQRQQQQQQDGEQPMLHTGPDERFEIVSLVGTLSPEGLHLHASLGDEVGSVCGGHLVRATVHTTAEIVVGVAGGLTFSREMDPATGFKELVVSAKTAPSTVVLGWACLVLLFAWCLHAFFEYLKDHRA